MTGPPQTIAAAAAAAAGAEPVLTSPAPAEPVSQVPCTICRRQFSKYTCARCNIPYCSLTCFRAESHADCSEGFYRRELEADIRTAPSKSAAERTQMLALLKRFEEEDRAADAPGDEDEDDADEDDLAGRLEVLDLDSATHDDIWDALTPAERARFSKALQDPRSELAQQLLASDAIDQDLVAPWWTASDDAPDTPAASGITLSHTMSRRLGAAPPLMDIAAALLDGATLEAASRLLYNFCAICIAYAHATRQLGTSPLAAAADDADATEARRLVGRLAPFLPDRRSALVHAGLESLVTDVAARLGPDEATPALRTLLLDDAAALLRPAVVAEVPAGADGAALAAAACPDLLRVLSDLHALFARAPASVPPATGAAAAEKDAAGAPPRETPATRKLAFYAAHAAKVPAPVWAALSQSLRVRAVRERGDA